MKSKQKVIEVNSKKLQLMKPVTWAKYESKTVITNSSWEYIALLLQRQGSEKARKALLFWNQAKNFYEASILLPIESRPLTSYYCCLNATKALLAFKGDNTINLSNIKHGISSRPNEWNDNNIKNAYVKFQGNGVLNELSKYLDEDSGNEYSYTIYDLMYNIPCIHRSFSITFGSTELFIPIKNTEFILNSDNKKAWIHFCVDDKYANGSSLRSLPSMFEIVKEECDDKFYTRSRRRFDWDIHSAKQVRLDNISKYHKKIRKNVVYISSDLKLWYLKKSIKNNNHLINRSSLTLIYAVMHWLSELVRYNPEKFSKLLSTKQNWVLREFVEIALNQFIDELSCEICGNDIMTAGIR